MLYHIRALMAQRQTSHTCHLHLKSTVSIFGFSISIIEMYPPSKRRSNLDHLNQKSSSMPILQHHYSRFVDIYTTLSH